MKSTLKNTNRGFASMFIILAVILLSGIGLYFSSAKSSPQVSQNVSNTTETASVITSEQNQESTTTIPTEVESTSPVVAVAVLPIENTETPVAPKVVVIKAEPKPEPVVAEVKKDPILVVSLGEAVPSSLLLHDAQRVPFEKIILEAQNGDVVVNKIVVQRTGMGTDNIFSEVGVDDGTGEWERGLNSNHQYVTRVPFTIKAGEQQEITLFGNVASDISEFDGQAPTLSLISIDASTPVQGNLPMTSQIHTANSSITIGSMSVTQDSFDPGTNRTFYINDKNVIFSAVKINLDGVEPILIDGISFNQNGSASRNDLENVKIVMIHRGKTYEFPTEISEDGKYYSADLGDGIRMGKGDIADIYIKGDIGTTGSNRTVDFDIYGSYDITGVGLSYGQSINSWGGDVDEQAPEGQFSTSMYPFYNAFAHTISAGTATSIGR